MTGVECRGKFPQKCGDRGLQGASEANGEPERWSPPSPAVSFSTSCALQYTAETAGSKAHLERTGKAGTWRPPSPAGRS